MSTPSFFHTNLDKTIQHQYDDYVQQQIAHKQYCLNRAKENYVIAKGALQRLQTKLEQASKKLKSITAELESNELTDEQEKQLLANKVLCLRHIDRLSLTTSSCQEQLQAFSESINATEENIRGLLQSKNSRLQQVLSPPE